MGTADRMHNGLLWTDADDAQRDPNLLSCVGIGRDGALTPPPGTLGMHCTPLGIVYRADESEFETA